MFKVNVSTEIVKIMEFQNTTNRFSLTMNLLLHAARIEIFFYFYFPLTVFRNNYIYFNVTTGLEDWTIVVGPQFSTVICHYHEPPFSCKQDTSNRLTIAKPAIALSCG